MTRTQFIILFNNSNPPKLLIETPGIVPAIVNNQNNNNNNNRNENDRSSEDVMKKLITKLLREKGMISFHH